MMFGTDSNIRVYDSDLAHLRRYFSPIHIRLHGVKPPRDPTKMQCYKMPAGSGLNYLGHIYDVEKSTLIFATPSVLAIVNLKEKRFLLLLPSWKIRNLYATPRDAEDDHSEYAVGVIIYIDDSKSDVFCSPARTSTETSRVPGSQRSAYQPSESRSWGVRRGPASDSPLFGREREERIIEFCLGYEYRSRNPIIYKDLKSAA